VKQLHRIHVNLSAWENGHAGEKCVTGFGRVEIEDVGVGGGGGRGPGCTNVRELGLVGVAVGFACED
jgi:hypothetical protein